MLFYVKFIVVVIVSALYFNKYLSVLSKMFIW